MKSSYPNTNSCTVTQIKRPQWVGGQEGTDLKQSFWAVFLSLADYIKSLGVLLDPSSANEGREDQLLGVSVFITLCHPNLNFRNLKPGLL